MSFVVPVCPLYGGLLHQGLTVSMVHVFYMRVLPHNFYYHWDKECQPLYRCVCYTEFVTTGFQWIGGPTAYILSLLEQRMYFSGYTEVLVI